MRNSNNTWQILIKPRYIKRMENGLRPFQQQLIDAIFTRKEKIITLEAPVGAGKTFAVRQLLERKEFQRCPIVLIYPTKILMESQVGSFKRELGENKVKIWPWETFDTQKINIFVYSTDTLVEYIKRNKLQTLQNRGELIYRLFVNLEWFSKYGGVATSPDVLYLLIEGKYKNSKKILNFLQNSLFIFDEFHCYYGLQTFIRLLDYLLEKVANKVILLSATPIKTNAFLELEKKYGVYNISFGDSKGESYDECFNYSLEMYIESFRFTNISETEKRLKDWLYMLPRPCAIIFDSIFRLRHITQRLYNSGLIDANFKEWSGMVKDKELQVNDQTVVLATSAIEVGIDMKFKSLIFEASYWPSAIQRLGRVGRKEEGIAVMFTRKDFYPYLNGVTQWERDEFEEILKNVLNDPREEIGDGYSFRGRSFNFILVDESLKETFIYNENLFSMYEIEDYVDDWRTLTLEKKYELLREFDVPQSKIENLLIYDKVVPFWGLLKGRLRDEYEYLSEGEIKLPTNTREELAIKGYVFYGS